MTWTEKTALVCMVLYSALYADAVDWTKTVAYACLFVAGIFFIVLGGKK